jgi:tocopherol cyclase
MLKKLHTLFHPEEYQGWGKTRRYFEGWYFKVVNADETRAFAFIPGIAMDENGVRQAFVQVLDGKRQTAEYHKFDATEFRPSFGKFEITLANCFFSIKEIVLNLPTAHGQLKFSNTTPWPRKWHSPGIMGPYSFVPFMECYHGILSMDHRIDGQLCIQGETIDFTNGRGYMEKDWGQSFPEAYFWLQTNHFSRPGISVKASVAKIPWLGNSFIGHIAGVYIDNRLFQFTTYNGTKLIKSFANIEKVELVLENSNHRLEILAHRHTATQLAAPIAGFMDGRIEESMTSNIDVQLWDKKNNKLLLSDTGRNAGLEVAGRIEDITVMPINLK